MPKTPRYGQRKKIQAEVVAMRVRQGMRMSRNRMRLLHRLCPSLQCTSKELLKAQKNVLPLFNRELTNSRLLVDVFFFQAAERGQKNETVHTVTEPFVAVHVCGWGFPAWPRQY